jgi:hypothetical protein
MPTQNFEVGNAPFPETLLGEDADFNFRLIEPTAVSGRVVHGESFPDLASQLHIVQIGQGFARMAAEIVHYEV